MLDTAGKPITIYPVVAANTLVAMVLETNDTQGYVAPIRLLTAIQMNTAGEPTIIGVRVSAHRETPGLGDKIEITRSDWLRQFAGRSLNAMATEGWAIRKDGGGFDQISGATVTSRAVVAGVNRTLETLANNQQAIKSQLAID